MNNRLTLCARIAFAFFLLVGSLSAATREAHWIEGEAFQSSTFNQHSWYQNTDIQKDLLSPGVPGKSPGAWLAHYTGSGNETATVTYRFTIGESGHYSCWIRLNPFRNQNGGANYSFSVDGTPYASIDLTSFLDPLDLVNPGIDIRFMAWGQLGEFDLTSGAHTLSIRLTRRSGDKENHGGIDVLALVNFPWAPSGVLPPDPTPPEPKPDEWFPLQAGPDPFSPDSIIDMSALIEKPAGLHGPLTRVGSDFQFKNGQPVKFWGVDAAMMRTDATGLEQARFFAKHGINMVRLHPVEGQLGVLTKNSATGQRTLNPASLDLLDRWFSTLKAQGIYSTWSLFYPHIITPDDGYPADLYAELPSQSNGRSSSGVVAFMPALQDAEWTWERTLLEHVNPYTGIRYADDPALAMVEVHNEDSIFWHAPLNDLASGALPKHQAILQGLWRDWLKAKYQTDTALRAAWGTGLKSGDSLNNSTMTIYGAWEMEATGPFFRKTEEKRRMGDFIRFLAETQRNYYQRRRQQLIDLGFRGLVVSTAWMAGGPAADAANLWTDDAVDAIDRHSYFGGGAGNHTITTGAVDNSTHLDRPGRGILSAGMYQVEDKPFIMTEWTQKPPNQWKAETAPLFAFYGMGLQGWDASFHFASSRTYMGSGWPGMSSYVTETPHYMGQFPALAFAIYHHHVAEGAAAASRRLAVDDIFKGIDALTQSYPGGGFNNPGAQGSLATPNEVLAIGRVSTKISDGPGPSQASDWNALWDQTQKTVSSSTGELTWDYGHRVVTVHSRKTQGIIGFAGGGAYDLPGVQVVVTTPFVSLLFTPLDDRDLKISEHILITAMARDQQTGAVYSPDGSQLLSTGGPPLLLEPVQAKITIKGPAIQTVKPADIYGVPTDRIIDFTTNTFQIDGRYATYYYEIKRSIPKPQLRVEWRGNELVLSWPNQASDIVLVEAGEAGGPWSDSSLKPTVGTVTEVVLQPSANKRFFRLELR